MLTRGRTIGGYVVAAALGLLAGCAGSFLQAAVIDAGPVEWPLGLVLALVLTATAGVGAGRVAGSRAGAVTALLAWLVAVVSLSSPRPEGDLVVASDTRGYVWLLGGAFVAVVCSVPPYAGRVPAP